eukprot:scaffold173567_cov19-Tisochrysis_lutea.AAC.1
MEYHGISCIVYRTCGQSVLTGATVYCGAVVCITLHPCFFPVALDPSMLALHSGVLLLPAFHPTLSLLIARLYSVLYGGASRGAQMTELRRQRPPIVVATPGRLQDFVEDGIICLSNVCGHSAGTHSEQRRLWR